MSALTSSRERDLCSLSPTKMAIGSSSVGARIMRASFLTSSGSCTWWSVIHLWVKLPTSPSEARLNDQPRTGHGSGGRANGCHVKLCDQAPCRSQIVSGQTLRPCRTGEKYKIGVVTCSTPAPSRAIDHEQSRSFLVSQSLRKPRNGHPLRGCNVGSELTLTQELTLGRGFWTECLGSVDDLAGLHRHDDCRMLVPARLAALQLGRLHVRLADGWCPHVRRYRNAASV